MQCLVSAESRREQIERRSTAALAGKLKDGRSTHCAAELADTPAVSDRLPSDASAWSSESVKGRLSSTCHFKSARASRRLRPR
jgi:hypothetical protein